MRFQHERVGSDRGSPNSGEELRELRDSCHGRRGHEVLLARLDELLEEGAAAAAGATQHAPACHDDVDGALVGGRAKAHFPGLSVTNHLRQRSAAVQAANIPNMRESLLR